MENRALLVEIQKLKGKDGLRKKDLMYLPSFKPDGAGSDNSVISSHHLHSLQRGAYKPSGWSHVLSVRLEANSSMYGRQIIWTDAEAGEFEKIIMAPPSQEGDVVAESDISALERNLIDQVPLGVFEKRSDKSSRCLGLARIVEKSREGLFILEPFELPDCEIGAVPPNVKYFAFKTSNEEFVNYWVRTFGEEFVFENLYQLGNDLVPGALVFLVLGGDKVPWQKGLTAICSIVEGPHDLGYDLNDPRKFRVKLRTELVFPREVGRQDFKGYPDCFDIPFITPQTKGEKNQPNAPLTREQVSKLSYVLGELFPELRERLNALLRLEIRWGPDTASQDWHIAGSDVPNNQMPPDIARNRIIYGPPGTGKSFAINDEVLRYFPHEFLRSRITFFPTVGYHDLVGAYKPAPIYRAQEGAMFYGPDKITLASHQHEPLIDYTLVPGPLLEMWTKALANPNKNFVLVIEEINRTNASAAFGDTFQLLDRCSSGAEQGCSVYKVRLNREIMHWFRMHGISSEEVGFPSNLYLWATMNSSDQGVQPLDSAFKRRWSFRFVGLNEHEHIVQDWKIELKFLDGRHSWNKVRRVLNRKLLELQIKEDKLIGPFFLTEEDASSDIGIKHKLLLYLKEDVMRYGNGLFVKTSLTEILEDYDRGVNIFNIDDREFYD